MALLSTCCLSHDSRPGGGKAEAIQKPASRRFKDTDLQIMGGKFFRLTLVYERTSLSRAPSGSSSTYFNNDLCPLGDSVTVGPLWCSGSTANTTVLRGCLHS